MIINKFNYENYAIDYLDGQLDPEEQRAMDTFLQAHPAIKQELAALATFEMPLFADISYPDKSELKKQEKLWINSYWIKAACLLVLLGLTLFLFKDEFSSPTNVQKEIAIAQDVKSVPEESTSNQAKDIHPNSEELVAETTKTLETTQPMITETVEPKPVYQKVN